MQRVKGVAIISLLTFVAYAIFDNLAQTAVTAFLLSVAVVGMEAA